MTTRYGFPPAYDDCVDHDPPEGLVLRLSQSVLRDVVDTPMVPGALNRRVTPEAVARQLNKVFDFGSDKPVRVQVEGYGTFLLGDRGWELV